MSDERFELFKSDITDWRIYDNELENAYFIDCEDEHTVEMIVVLLNQLNDENEELRQKIKHCVYVDVDNGNGCMNCKYDIGSICSILDCGTHDYLEGVSECGLKYWECKDE